MKAARWLLLVRGTDLASIPSGGRAAAIILAGTVLLACLAGCNTSPNPNDGTPPDVRLLANSANGAVTVQADNSENHPDPLPLDLTLNLAASASDSGGMSLAALSSTVRWQCMDGTKGEKVIGPASSSAARNFNGQVSSSLIVNLGISADAAGLSCRSQDSLKQFSVDASVSAKNSAGLVTKLSRHWRYIGPPDFRIVPYDGREFLGTVEQAQTWCGSFTPPNPPCVDLVGSAYEAIIKSGWLLSVDSVIFETRDRSVMANTPFSILFTVKNSGKFDSPPDAKITWFVYPGSDKNLGKLIMQRSLTLGPVLANPDLPAFLMLEFGPLNAGTYTLRASIDHANRLGTVLQGKQASFVVTP